MSQRVSGVSIYSQRSRQRALNGQSLRSPRKALAERMQADGPKNQWADEPGPGG